MKKLLSLSAVLIVLLLITESCSKKEFELVNTWKNTKVRQEVFYGNNWFAVNDSGEGKVTFREDKSGTSTTGGFVDGDFTWTLTNDILTVTRANHARIYKLTTMEYDTMVAERDTRDEDGNGELFIFTFALE